jgi:hypothetical protein
MCAGKLPDFLVIAFDTGKHFSTPATCPTDFNNKILTKQ